MRLALLLLLLVEELDDGFFKYHVDFDSLRVPATPDDLDASRVSSRLTLTGSGR